MRAVYEGCADSRFSVEASSALAATIRPDLSIEELDLRREKRDNPTTMRSLGLLFVAFTTLVAIQGCGSDSTTKKGDAGLQNAGGSPASSLGTGGAAPCVAGYCPAVNGYMPCCATATTCGYNTSNGCVPSGLKPDAGAH
jgi:hypothetical protein